MLSSYSISVFYPCYNEEGNIERVIQEAMEILPRVAEDYEIIIVNDGSTDRTADIANRLARENRRIRVVHHWANKGYGGALQSGFKAASKRLVFYTDGDGQFDISEISKLLPLIQEFDIVSGYRINRQDSLIRSLNGFLWGLLVRAVLGFKCRDVDCAFKLYRREIFDRIPIKSSGALIDAEILARAKRAGYRLAQMSVHHRPRLAGEQSEELAWAMRHWRVSLPDFPLRAVCMYMICEPARGARNKPVIEGREEGELGKLMAAAHDGDRVVRWPDDEHSEPYDGACSDELLDRLARMADSDDPSEREAAQLHWQPGGFGCSCPELDLLVDVSNSIDGVIGARVTGAGMGGCMFAYAHADAVSEVLAQVSRRYYAPRGLPLAAWELFPTERAGPVVLPGA